MANAPRKRQTVPGRESADKYYRSPDVSTVGTSRPMGDGVRRSGEFPSAIPTPRQSADDRGADKYYAVGGSDRRKVSAALSAATAPTKIVKKAGVVAVAGGVTIITLNAKEEIPLALNALLAETADIVAVKFGDRKLLQSMRAVWDQQLARETVTEARHGAVAIKFGPKPADAEEVPVAAAVPVTAVPPLDVPPAGEAPTRISDDAFAEKLVAAGVALQVEPEQPAAEKPLWEKMAEDAPVEPVADPVGEKGELGQAGEPEAEPEAKAVEPSHEDDSDDEEEESDDSDEE